MSLAWNRFKVYVRGSIIVLVLAAVAILAWKNRANRVAIWFFGLTNDTAQINVLWLLLATISGALLGRRMAMFAWKFLRDLQELRKSAAIQREMQLAVQRPVDSNAPSTLMVGEVAKDDEPRKGNGA